MCRYRMEQDEKFENQLNLALDLSEEERERSKDLDAGYDKETDQWEIIFRYAGTLDTIRWSDTTRIEPLSMGCDRLYKRRRVGSIWGK